MRSICVRFVVAGLVLGIAACASPAKPAPSVPSAPETEAPSGEAFTRDLRPQNGAPVFLGISQRTRDRGQEEALAIEHIAQQASRYIRAAAIYQYVSQRGSDGIGYLDDIATHWDEQLA
ncbi:MAG: hypothetical protein ACOCYB_05920, partial [Alkalispirochaeta sp.]